ncbi:MAG: cell division protein SepF [Candidatus Marsarchaeota archaeon]|nr:cell division protein SepF [Candidatus Marsarchaeota archaeon]
MGFFDKIGKNLGTSKELDIEEYMNSDEMANVDVMNEPADFYVKPVILKDEEDISFIEAELDKRNIIIADISELMKRENTRKELIAKLKEYITKINGDIGQLGVDKVMLTPAKVKIIKTKKQPPK